MKRGRGKKKKRKGKAEREGGKSFSIIIPTYHFSTPFFLSLIKQGGKKRKGGGKGKKKKGRGGGKEGERTQQRPFLWYPLFLIK